MDKKLAYFELIFAASLWGMGFVATIWGLKIFSASEILFLRFSLAFGFGELIRFIFKIKKNNGFSQSLITWINQFKENINSAKVVGFFLGATLLIQTIGLKYTTATKSGFLTTLYVVLVPITAKILFKNTIKNQTFLNVLIALIGSLILMQPKLNNVNKGDLLTILCALVASFHIIYIGKAAPFIKDSFQFNNFQSFWAMLIILPSLLYENFFITTNTDLTLSSASQSKSLSDLFIVSKFLNLDLNSTTTWLALLGLSILVFGSSIVAFLIQIRTQKILSATAASIFFLLESPFAFLFGFLFLNEELNYIQILGAGLIIIASFLQIRVDESNS